MKKHLIIIVIFLLPVLLGLCGCTEQNQKIIINDDFVFAPVHTFGLSLQSVPEGFELVTEEYHNYSGKEVNISEDISGNRLETYQMRFSNNGTDQNTTYSIIDVVIIKYSSIDDALAVLVSNDMICSNMYTTNYSNSYEIIGEQSFIYGGDFIYAHGEENKSYVTGMFRTINVCVSITLSFSYDVGLFDKFIEYARIIEDKINQSML
jgi:hypothetical protein